jgi:thioredoxin 1
MSGATANLIDVTDETFEQLVLDATIPVVVEFTAPWCPPCQAIAPILHELAAEYAGRLKLAKVNTDDNPRYVGELGILGQPTLVIFKDGKEVDRLVGARRKAHYQARFDAVIQKRAT